MVYDSNEFDLLFGITGDRKHTREVTPANEVKNTETLTERPVKVPKRRIAHVSKYVNNMEFVAIDHNQEIKSTKIRVQQGITQPIDCKRKNVRLSAQNERKTLSNENNTKMSSCCDNGKRKRDDRNISAAQNKKLKLSQNILDNFINSREVQKKSVKETIFSNFQDIVAVTKFVKPQEARPLQRDQRLHIAKKFKLVKSQKENM